MIANVDKVIEFLEVNDLPYFTVQTKEGENSKIFETGENESFEDAKARFRRVMEFCHGNRFIIKARKDFKGTRGGFTEEFRNNSDNVPAGSITPTINGAPSPNVGYVAIGELERRLQDERTRILQDVKIERLEAENKDLKDEINATNTTLNNALKRAEPYIGTILGNIVGRIIPHPAATAQIGVAGINASPSVEEGDEVENTEELQHRLESALQKWNAVEPKMLEIIEKLAEMAATGDSMYTMAKGMLIK